MNILTFSILLHLFLFSSGLAFSQPNRNCNPHQFVKPFSERFKLIDCKKVPAGDIQNFYIHIKEGDALKKYHVIGEFMQASYHYEKSIWEGFKYPKTDDVFNYYKEAYAKFETHTWLRSKSHIQFFLKHDNDEYFIYTMNMGDIDETPDIMYALLKRVVKIQSMTLVEE